jgi:hypothetical protein
MPISSDDTKSCQQRDFKVIFQVSCQNEGNVFFPVPISSSSSPEKIDDGNKTEFFPSLEICFAKS